MHWFDGNVALWKNIFFQQPRLELEPEPTEAEDEQFRNDAQDEESQKAIGDDEEEFGQNEAFAERYFIYMMMECVIII